MSASHRPYEDLMYVSPIVAVIPNYNSNVAQKFAINIDIVAGIIDYMGDRTMWFGH